MHVANRSESVLNASFERRRFRLGAGMNQSSGESASCNRESSTVHNDLRQTVLLSGERGRDRCCTLLSEPIVERRHVDVQDLPQASGVLLELRLEVVEPLSRRGWGPVVGVMSIV